jgi:histidine triad (HIT) family protein
MPSVFTLIINGDLPGRFVWKDDLCVAFLSINPLQPGHTLVVPRDEVSHWIDLEPDTMRHVVDVSRLIGKAIDAVYGPEKVGLMIAGLEVPHTHVHVSPIYQVDDLDFANADPNPEPVELDAAAEALREQLAAMGHPLP